MKRRSSSAPPDVDGAVWKRGEADDPAPIFQTCHALTSPSSAFLAFPSLSEGTEAPSLCGSCLSRLAREQTGTFQRMPSTPPSLRPSRSSAGERVSVEGITSMQVSPKCSRRRFAHGIHEIVRASGQAKHDSPRSRGPDALISR